MKREEVLNVVNDEREYQESQKYETGSHVVEDFPLAAALEAIRYNLNKANEAWYTGADPHTKAMHYLRKISALTIQMGETYGMPSRSSQKEKL